jgi:hypothetical protein
MSRDEAIAFAKKVSQLDTDTCGELVESLMLSRTLSKVVRELDKLSREREHGELASLALKKLGFDA